MFLREWDDAAVLTKERPQEVRTWIRRMEPDGSTLRWRVLPIHAAAIYGGPKSLLEDLVKSYPDSVRVPDDRGLLPHEVAEMVGRYDSVLSPHETERAIVVATKTAAPGNNQASCGDFFNELVTFWLDTLKQISPTSSAAVATNPTPIAVVAENDSTPSAAVAESDPTPGIDLEIKPTSSIVEEDHPTTSAVVEESNPAPSVVVETNSTESDDAPIEVDYENATELFSALRDRQWEQAARVVKENPTQAATWILRKETDGTTMRWRLLPLHCAIIYGAPQELIHMLLEAYPAGAGEMDDQGMLPHQLANHVDSSKVIILALIQAVPPPRVVPVPPVSPTSEKTVPEEAEVSEQETASGKDVIENLRDDDEPTIEIEQSCSTEVLVTKYIAELRKLQSNRKMPAFENPAINCHPLMDKALRKATKGTSSQKQDEGACIESPLALAARLRNRYEDISNE